MPLGNCKICGAVFSQVNTAICPKCIRKEEEDYIVAKQWLVNNPGHTIDNLSEGTGIAKRFILKWIRENRLEMTDAADVLKCKRCNKPITSGNFCDHCKLGLSHDVKEGIETIEEEIRSTPPKPKGMYYHPPSEREKRGKK